ncbi:MAG: FHA domain-containing protein [Candidatus Eremiobacteraeota bacterium]|nr:FHA domain-containing protein [Candidatus Eremiobacteraeota bacterium]
MRLETFGIVVATGAFALASMPARRRRRVRDDAMTAMQAVILRVEEDGGTRTVRAPVPITIGRAQTATLAISDAQVSRLHARIDLTDGTLTLRDLDSRNGTLVNARPIDVPVTLRDGDEIDIGTTRITFMGFGPWK